MGCYGSAPSRVMGTIAECLSDDRGLVWRDEVAPYRVHLASLVQRPTDVESCTVLYDDLQARGVDVLYDDREDIQPGEKLADADLIGLPHRLVVSRRTLAAGVIEWKKRTAADSIMLQREEAINLVASP